MLTEVLQTQFAKYGSGHSVNRAYDNNPYFASQSPESEMRTQPKDEDASGNQCRQQRSLKLTGNGPAIHHIQGLIERVSSSTATVLITGESGTGKELVARNLHQSSNRRKSNFVAVNCGAISPELLESELFGHEKGAFTGAIGLRKGKFEQADGGTLFLDEIGDMPLDMQVKLLRVLQERSFERVGGNVAIPINIRVIAATHRNLELMVEDGSFREDLYYRLCVFPIQLPALRDRIEDLPVLILELLANIYQEQGITVSLDKATIAQLAYYHWPGNIRELQHLLLRLALLHPNEIVKPDHLPKKYRSKMLQETDQQASGQFLVFNHQNLSLPEGGIDMKAYLNEIEIKLIQSALAESNGVVAQAAKILGLRRTTLIEKLRRFGLKTA